jgi:hypothetical protein
MRATDGTQIPGDLGFNTHFEPIGSSKALIHASTTANTMGNYTIIDNPLTNGKANAQLQVSMYSAPQLNNHHIGVFYFNGKWAIYNQDRQPLTIGTQFNVLSSDIATQTVVAKRENLSNNSLYLRDLPQPVRGNPTVRLLVTQNWTPKGIYNDHAVGVWFDRSQGLWAVYNEDRSLMPENAAFNVDWDAQVAIVGRP